MIKVKYFKETYVDFELNESIESNTDEIFRKILRIFQIN